MILPTPANGVVMTVIVERSLGLPAHHAPSVIRGS
jgi:hypothetical protein